MSSRLIVKCPGCLVMVPADELCCDRCWKRTPLRLRVAMRKIIHKKSNWDRYLAAEQAVRDWLAEHADHHYETRKMP